MSSPKNEQSNGTINEETLYGEFYKSLNHRREVELLAVRKAWNLPAGDGVRDIHTTETTIKEQSPLEKVLVAGALVAIVAFAIGGLMALPSILDRISPPPVVQPSLEVPEDMNDVFELGLHEPNKGDE